MKRFPLYLVIGITLLHTTPVLSASEDQDQTSCAEKTAQAEKNGSPMTVAVVLDDKPSEAVRAAEMVVSAALGNHRSVTVLDRNHIQKVLAEHKQGTAGTIRQPTRMGKLLGAQYLISLQPVPDRPMTVGGLCIDVATGNVLWEGATRIDRKSDSPIAWIQPILKAITVDRKTSTAATVLVVTNKSKIRRMDFLQTSLHHLLEDVLADTGYRVLRRRLPGVIGKETALGASGLVRPDAAVIAQSADVSLSATFSESPSSKVVFEDTPITLRVSLKTKAGESTTKTVRFTLNTMDTLPATLGKMLPKKVTHVSGNDAPNARIEAARLMSTLKDLKYVSPLDQHRRQVEIAKRVIYLDPSAKEAYYRLGISLRTLSMKAKPREVTRQEARDALLAYTRFPRTNREHVKQAFSYALQQDYYMHHRTPKNCLPLIKEQIRWVHSMLPQGPTWKYHLRHGDVMNNRLFTAKERLELLNWIDDLFVEKRYRSVVGYQKAHVLSSLGRKKEAAEFFYDYIVTQNRPFPSARYSQSLYRQWAGALPEKQKNELLKRLEAKLYTPPKGLLAAFYGREFGDDATFYKYKYRACDEQLKIESYPMAAVEPIELASGVYQTLLVRSTKAGVWVQAGMCDKSLKLFFSPDGLTFSEVPLPESLAKIRMASRTDAALVNLIRGIEQIGNEVFFATYHAGLWRYDLSTKKWRKFSTQDGLASETLDKITSSPDGKNLWIVGGKSVTRYAEGKFFVPRIRVPLFVPSLGVDDKQLFVFKDEPFTVWGVDQRGGGPKPLVTRNHISQAYSGIRKQGYFLPFGYNAGHRLIRRMAVTADAIYAGSKMGLWEVSSDGKKRRLWYPMTLRHDGGYLGGWIEGNCSLPFGILGEVIVDDQNPDRLWILTQSRDTGHYEQFGESVSPMKMQPPGHRHGPSPLKSYLTSFDTQTQRFSKPVALKGAAFHIESRGEYVYLTGYTFRRMKKSLCRPDQPAKEPSAPVKILTPDTPMGHVSKAWLQGDNISALKLLDAFLKENPQYQSSLNKTRHQLEAQIRRQEKK
jgi:hypothetical protein